MRRALIESVPAFQALTQDPLAGLIATVQELVEVSNLA